MSKTKRRVGDTETSTYRWEWRQCDHCHLPAKYKATFLLPNGRNNPSNSAYNYDDCSWWCTNVETFVCERHKWTRLDGYESCSIFPLARFQHMGWYKVQVENSDEEEFVFEETELAALRETIIEALFTDGAHHKQWYLEQILAVILQATGEDIEDILEDCERGVTP